MNCSGTAILTESLRNAKHVERYMKSITWGKELNLSYSKKT